MNTFIDLFSHFLIDNAFKDNKGLLEICYLMKNELANIHDNYNKILLKI